MRSGNVWEAGIVNIVTRCLRQDPAMGLFDIGANIGQYSLIAGKMGHQVVAVEALQRHVSMVHKSTQLNGIQDKIKLIHNAVSNSRKTVSIHQTPGNYGGSYLVNSSSGAKANRALAGSVSVQSILLDDLLEVTPFKKAVMKIDIEGHEPFAILSGPKLFDSIYIPYIFMEFGQLAGPHYAKTKAVTSKMLTFLQSRHYVAYTYQRKPLPTNTFQKWPWDIFFKHKNASMP